MSNISFNILNKVRKEYEEKSRNLRKSNQYSSKYQEDSDEDDDDGPSEDEINTKSKKYNNNNNDSDNDDDDDEPPSEDEISTKSKSEKFNNNNDNRNSLKPSLSSTKMKMKRAHKHAPSESSTKKRVSVVRDIPGLNPIKRSQLLSSSSNSNAGTIAAEDDIRFDTAFGKADLVAARKNYSFLDEYRKDEISALKEVLREDDMAIRQNKKNNKNNDDGNNQTVDDDDNNIILPTLGYRERYDIQKKIQSLEGQVRTMQRRDFEHEVLTNYKKQVKSGERKGPLYLKRGDQRKLILSEQFKVMKKKDIEKALERKRKRNSGRERKLMPDERRG